MRRSAHRSVPRAAAAPRRVAETHEFSLYVGDAAPILAEDLPPLLLVERVPAPIPAPAPTIAQPAGGVAPIILGSIPAPAPLRSRDEPEPATVVGQVENPPPLLLLGA